MGAKQNRNPWGTRTRLQIPNLPVAGAPHRPNRLDRRRGSCSGRPRWAGTVVSTSCRRSGGTSTGSTTRRRSASTRPRPPARTSSSARPPAAASPTPASSRSAATGASRLTRPPLPVPRLRPSPPPGPRIRSPRRGPHPVPPDPRFQPPSPPTETISTSSPAAVGPPTSPRLPPLAVGGARLGRGSLRQTLSQTLRNVRRRRRLGRRGLTTRSTSWVTALPGRVWRCPGTCRSLWLPPPRRGEITPKATGRRGVEGRRVSRSLERRGGRGRPRRRIVSEPCLPLQQGRRGSRTGDTRRGMCVDDARVCVILSAGSAMDVYWRKPKMGGTNLHENILKDNCGGKKQCCSGVIG